jgi:hypothetical protein
MTPSEILGILSATLLLGTFIANEWGGLSSESIWYDLFNLVASIGLFVYAYHLGAVPFMVTNGVWGLVSLVDVIKDMRRGSGLKRGRK